MVFFIIEKEKKRKKMLFSVLPSLTQMSTTARKSVINMYYYCFLV